MKSCSIVDVDLKNSSFLIYNKISSVLHLFFVIDAIGFHELLQSKKLSSVQRKRFVSAVHKSSDTFSRIQFVTLFCYRERCFKFVSDVYWSIVHSDSSDCNSLQNFTASHEIDSERIVSEWSSCEYFSRLHFLKVFDCQHYLHKKQIKYHQTAVQIIIQIAKSKKDRLCFRISANSFLNSLFKSWSASSVVFWRNSSHQTKLSVKIRFLGFVRETFLTSNFQTGEAYTNVFHSLTSTSHL